MIIAVVLLSISVLILFLYIIFILKQLKSITAMLKLYVMPLNFKGEELL